MIAEITASVIGIILIIGLLIVFNNLLKEETTKSNKRLLIEVERLQNDIIQLITERDYLDKYIKNELK